MSDLDSQVKTSLLSKLLKWKVMRNIKELQLLGTSLKTLTEMTTAFIFLRVDPVILISLLFISY